MSLLLPNYKQGFAPRDFEPQHPSLWQGCVGAWAMCLGPTGTRLFDFSGRQNWGTLTLIDPATKWIVSRGQYALLVNSAGRDCVNMGDVCFLPNDFTVCCWVRKLGSTTGSSFNNIWGVGRWNTGAVGGTNEYVLLIGNGNTGNDDIPTSSIEIGSTRYTTVGTTAITINQWQHVAIVRKSDTFSQFLDGKLNGTVTTPTTAITNRSRNLKIGDVDGGGDLNANAEFDDARIYNRALSQNELSILASRRGIAYEPRRTRKWYFRGFTPPSSRGAAKVNNTQIVTGSYQNGFAPRDGEPAYPELLRGLVGAWCPSLGQTGLTLRDNSPAENHGTLTNMDAATDWVVSGGQYALDFDGVNDKVAGIGSTSSFSFIHTTGVLSIAFWAKFDTDGTRLTVAGNTLANTEKGFFVIRENVTNYGTNVMRCTVNGGVGGSYAVFGTTNDNVALAGSWDHWCYISNYSNTIGQWYKNGIAVTTTTRFNPGDLFLGSVGSGDSTRVLGLGIATFSSDLIPLDGQLDDFRIYNRALTPAEIRLLASRRGIGFDYRRKRTYSFIADTKAVARPKIETRIPGGVHTGIAPRDSEPAFPSLWEGCVGAWCPSVSPPGGTVLRDYSGLNNNGTLTNMDAATDWVVSGGRYALDFDGSNDEIDYGTNVSLAGEKRVSFSAWIYRATQGQVFALSRYNTNLSAGNVRGDLFGTNNITLNGQVALSITNSSTVNDYLNFYSTQQVPAAQWTHIAATAFIDGNNSTCNMWINGVATTVNSDHSGTRPTAWQANNSVSYRTSRIINSNGSSSYSSGIVDDLRTYNRALTEPEIRLLASRRGIAYERRSKRHLSTIEVTSAFRSAYLRRQSQIIGGGTW